MLGDAVVTRTSGTFAVRRRLLGKVKEVFFPYTGWVVSSVNGGSIPTAGPTFVLLRTDAQANSSETVYTSLVGWSTANLSKYPIDWDLPMSVFFSIERDAADTEAVSRVQVKEATGIGALGEKGFGINLANFTLTGEAYGSSRDTVSLMTIAEDKVYYIEMRKTTAGVEFLVDNVSKGSITTAGKFPSGDGAGNPTLLASHANGGTGTASDLCVIMPRMIQEI